MVTSNGAVSLKLSDFVDDKYPGFIKEAMDRDSKPQVASRKERQYLRISQGDTISALPTAIQTVMDYYQLPQSMTEVMQFLTLEALKRFQDNELVKACAEAYKGSIRRAAKSALYRDIRDKGSSYVVNPKSEKPLTIFAFSDSVADAFSGLAIMIGMPCYCVVQLASCLVLSECEEALEPVQVEELKEEVRKGLVRIALYKHMLEFDENCVNVC